MERELERLRREPRLSRSPTLAELVEVYLASLTTIEGHYGHLAGDTFLSIWRDAPVSATDRFEAPSHRRKESS